MVCFPILFMRWTLYSIASIALALRHPFFPWKSTFKIEQPRQKNLHFLSSSSRDNNHDDNTDNDKDTNFPTYKVYNGCILEELGLELTICDSVLGVGKGLFLALIDESIDEVEVSPGQILCGYSKGTFENQAKGDKTVGYNFNDLSNGVIFNKKLMTLSDAISIHIQTLSNKSKSSKQQIDFKNILQGHILNFSQLEDGTEVVGISADESFKNRYFVPFEVSRDEEITISNMGVFANDMAFNLDSGQYDDQDNDQLSSPMGVSNEDQEDSSFMITDSETDNSFIDHSSSSSSSVLDDETISHIIDSEAVLYSQNLLELVWRLEATESGVLVPTWPVVLFAGPGSTRFRNPQPVEVGLSYASGYWKAYTAS